MTPLEFLKVEFENVSLTLRETLRHDYGPAQSADYYRECAARLTIIKTNIAALKPADAIKIHGTLNELSYVATFVSLIERSRLGEFSWPFADELRKVAKALLAEVTLGGDPVEPIIHVMSEGEGYKIFYEAQVPPTSSTRRFLVVAFPRPLKHHVLLHTLFGHEVGHTAITATTTATVLQGKVLKALTASSPLKNVTTMNAWLNRADAPNNVKNELAAYTARTRLKFEFNEENRESWLVELICDAFGLLLFGPAFLAAHHAYLLPLEPRPNTINVDESTHPPFSIRHKFLIQLMKSAKWNTPITSLADGNIYLAEKDFLDSLLQDTHDNWAAFFTDAEIDEIVSEIKLLFQSYGSMSYEPASSTAIKALIKRLIRGSPPILDSIDASGKVHLESVRISQTLYAGWAYWAGREHLKLEPNFIPLDFLSVNKLCDYALLQQRAIDLTISARNS